MPIRSGEAKGMVRYPINCPVGRYRAEKGGAHFITPSSVFMAGNIILCLLQTCDGWRKKSACSRISFSSFRRRISFSCSLTCLRRIDNSSARLFAVYGVCEPGPASSRPSLAAFVHAYMVFSGMPCSEAVFAPPGSFASFTAWILYSMSYFRCFFAIVVASLILFDYTSNPCV